MTKIGASPWQHLFERLVAELDQPTSPDWQVARTTLDPKVYYDVGRFQAERDQLLRRLPLCLGHIDQLAEPGAVLALDFWGTPLLMARGWDRELRYFLTSAVIAAHGSWRSKEKCAGVRVSFARIMLGLIASMDHLPACPAPRPFPISIATCSG